MEEQAKQEETYVISEGDDKIFQEELENTENDFYKTREFLKIFSTSLIISRIITVSLLLMCFLYGLSFLIPFIISVAILIYSAHKTQLLNIKIRSEHAYIVILKQHLQKIKKELYGI